MIWGILFLATVLRLINLNQSLWLDEAINVLAVKNNTFWNMITQYSIGDFHPPGYFVLLWIWTHLFGFSEISVRIPSVIFGVLTIWLVYLLGKEMFNKKIGLVASLFLTLAPLHVYYSQETRMYSFATFSATLSFYFFWKLINQKSKWDVVGYTVASILVLYSDYLVYLIFPAQFFYLVFWQRNYLRKILIAWVVILISGIPWLFVFPKQLANGIAVADVLPGWASVVGGSSLKELLLIPIKTFFGRISIENKLFYGLLIGLVGLFYGFIIWMGVKRPDKPIKLLFCWIIIPITLACFISFFIPVLSYFRMLFILPAVYLLLAKGIDSLGKFSKLGLIGICLISLVSLGAYYTNPKFQREDWKSVVPFIEFKLKEASLVLLNDNGIFAPYTYYSNNLDKVSPGLWKIPAKSEEDVKEIPNVKEIYLFEYLVDITDPDRLLQKSLEKSGFKESQVFNFNGVGFVRHFILEL